MNDHTLEDIVNKVKMFLNEAQHLMTCEGYYGVMSRAYYAMFHSMQALLYIRNIEAKSHKGAHNAFHKEFISTQIIAKEHGLALKRSFEKRQFSDYDYDEVSQEDAKESLDDAARFVEAVIQYLKENNHLQ
ncbi:HEPN domain-containing protein [Dyadobacter flavalbus]|uniref:HEPN domain-containing protein n=1 Tax=Dyadobacter flavalbus TaxID=2579942 RepID=A0A5M8QKK8_9BACT|nr:HEPN domain-containing protein [Dyadobacter flavalbus]KAA6436645.1 HEPN domain-containing protein [Dyadobacter flavalbus]